MYETYYAHPADECPNCRKDHNKRLHRERLEPNKGAKWVVVSDPCDAPMFEGRRLSSQEVYWGLKLGSLVPGMRLSFEGKDFEVTAAGTLRDDNQEFHVWGNGNVAPILRAR